MTNPYPQLKSVVCLILVAGCAAGRSLAVQTPPTQKAPRQLDQISAEIACLEAKDFRTRQKATRALIGHGQTAIRPLLLKVRRGRLELAVRAIKVFETAYAGKDTRASDLASDALEELAMSSRPEIADHARQALERHQVQRTRRAVRELRNLGAEINHFAPEKKELTDDPRDRGFRRSRERDPYIILDDAWKGGTEGLKYVRRLPVPPFQIYVIDGVPIPEKALVELEGSFEGTTVVRRGSAMLGVSGSSGGGGGCQILSVEPNTAAEKAGLQEGDFIVGYNGKPVRDFTELVGMLREQKAGDTIALTIIPANSFNAREVEKPVTLGKWRPPTPAPKVKPKP